MSDLIAVGGIVTCFLVLVGLCRGLERL